MNQKGNKTSVELKASIVYTIASLFSKGLAIITVPIFTRLMSTEQMGIVNLYNSWHSMISVVATLSLTSGGYIIAMKEFKNERDKYMSSVLTLTSCMAIVLTVIYLLSPTYWESLTGLSRPLMILLLFGLLVSPATEFWLARQRYEYKYVNAGVVTIVSALVASVISIVALIVAEKMGYKNLGEVRLFSNFFVVYGVALVLWIYIFVKGKVLVNSKYWKYSLALSIPLIGNSMASQILSVSDRTMISSMVGNDAVGIYSVLYTVSSISLIIWSAINSSFVPFLFEGIEKEEKKEPIKKVANQLMFAYGTMAFLITLVAPEIVRILATEEYYEAIYIMPPIAAGVFLTSISNMYSNVLIYHKKTQFIMISSITAAVINVTLNCFAINKWGYMAAAYTTMVAYIVLAIIQAVVSIRVHRAVQKDKQANVYNNSFLLKVSIITIVLCLCCLFLYRYNIVRYMIIIGACIVGIIYRDKIIGIFKKR